MTIYGESTGEFRPRPTAAALFAVSTGQILLAFLLSASFASIIDTIMAFKSGWKTVLVIYVPFADDPMSPFFVSPPLDRFYLLAEPIVAASALLFALLLLVFWPTSSGMATRLFIHTFALAIEKGIPASEIASRVYAYPTFHADLKFLV